MFKTQYKYDSFGRMRNIVYPDGEVVHYGYTTGGLLWNVAGWKQGHTNVYLWGRIYDERYKFTGKERDAETGYDYFGARYYWGSAQKELNNHKVTLC